MHRARHLTLATLLALVALTPSVAGAAEQPLAAQWHLDQVTDDGTRTPDSGPNNLVSAAAGSPAVIPGRFSNALRLAVPPSRVEVDGTPVLTPAQLTVMAWVRRTGNPGAFRYVVSRGDRDCLAASYALYTGNSGGLVFYVDPGQAPVPVSPDAGPGIWDGAWHAVAGTYDGARLRLYVDGHEIGSGTPAASATIDYAASGSSLFRLGAYTGPCSAGFAGDIDEARVYDRALTAAEIGQLQAAGATTPPELDSDRDAVPNARDNCPFTSNANQRDGNGDGIGDACASVPAGAVPRNLVRPKIVTEPGVTSTYRCRPGSWAGLDPGTAATAYSYQWLRIDPKRTVVVSTAATYRSPPAVLRLVADRGSYHVCQVTARNRSGAANASSPAAFLLPGVDPVQLHPRYGNVRIRGIDVFQVTQPNSGATQFGFPSGRFPFFPGGGTPNGITRTQSGILGGTFQSAVYNGVTLDATKPAWATVYVDVAGAEPLDPTQPLELTLTRRLNGVPLDSLHSSIKNPPRSDTYWVTADERTKGRFVFRLPSNWLFTTSSQRFDLQARVTFPMATGILGLRQCDVAGCGDDDTYLLRGVPSALLPFTAVSTLQLTRAGQGALTAPDAVLFTARRLWPGGERMFVRGPAATIDVTASTDRVATDTVCSKTGLTARFCRMAGIDGQLSQWAVDNPGILNVPGFKPLRIYDFLFGVHNYQFPQADGTIATEPGWSIGNIEALPSAVGQDQPFFSANANSRSISAAAHELGHQLSARHTAVLPACSAATGTEPWPPDGAGRLQGVLFPRPDAIGRRRPPRVDGIETLYDLMSYCANTDDSDSWVGPYNWNRAFTRLGEYAARRQGFQGFSARTTAAAPPGAFAVGTVGPSGGAIERIAAADASDDVPAPVPSSPVHVRSLAAGGALLLDAGVIVTAGSEGGGGTFAGPVAAAAARVELVRGGVVLDSRARSQAPRVSVLAPGRGTSVRARGSLAVRWRASDPDQDVLQATVDATSDGRAWRTIYQGADRGRARLPGRYLEPGRHSRVRVTVNDGFSEATARSATFSAEGAPPTARIVRPEAREPLVAGTRVELIGDAVDAIGRPLRGRSLTWFAGSRLLGRGGRLRVRSLPAGRVGLRLVARDRTGRTGAARRMVRVVAEPPRLTLLRADRVVKRTAKTVEVRARTASPARLRIAGRSYSVGGRTKKLRVRLPARPLRGVVTLRYELRGAGGRIRGTLQVLRA
jgi:hypothetical protein